MISLKKRDQGFTIIELLIVIVVIGILAALVLNSFSGVQARARDTERRTDINAIATQLEVYYNDEGSYPVTADLTPAWAEANLPGFDTDALSDPRGHVINSTDAAATYDYVSADGSSFTLTADLETATPDPYTKTSLNN